MYMRLIRLVLYLQTESYHKRDIMQSVEDTIYNTYMYVYII